MHSAPASGEPVNLVVAAMAGPLMDLDAVVIRFDYTSSPTQSIEQPTKGRNYAIGAIKARRLIEELSTSLAMLDEYKRLLREPRSDE